jgi:hypothetical protein
LYNGTKPNPKPLLIWAIVMTPLIVLIIILMIIRPVLLVKAKKHRKRAIEAGNRLIDGFHEIHALMATVDGHEISTGKPLTDR